MAIRPMRHFPLPFTAKHFAYSAGEVNEDGNAVPGHLDPVPVACIWWSPDSSEPNASDRVLIDLVLAVDSSLAVGSRDYFEVDAYPDVRFDVVGLPKDYDHGPFGFRPGRRIVELKAVQG